MVFGKIDCELAANWPFGLFVGCIGDGFVVTVAAEDDLDLYKKKNRKMLLISIENPVKIRIIPTYCFTFSAYDMISYNFDRYSATDN